MRRYLAGILAVLLMLSALPAASSAQQLGSIAGIATDAEGSPAANHTVRLRNADTGALEGEVTSNAQGEYEFTNIPEGNYVVEVVDVAGNIVGTSSTIALAAGAAVVGVAIASSAGVAAAAAAAGAGAFFASTAGIVTAAAVAGGVTVGAIAAKDPASPSS